MEGAAAATATATATGMEAAAAAFPKVERLNQAVQNQLNLDAMKTRAQGLSKAISRILDDFDAIARTNSVPKWYFSFFRFFLRYGTRLSPSQLLSSSSFAACIGISLWSLLYEKYTIFVSSTGLFVFGSVLLALYLGGIFAILWLELK